jgi:hypothetical protein
MVIDLRDVLALVGALLTVLGLWLIFPPAALIAAGVSLTALAVLPVLRGRGHGAS